MVDIAEVLDLLLLLLIDERLERGLACIDDAWHVVGEQRGDEAGVVHGICDRVVGELISVQRVGCKVGKIHVGWVIGVLSLQGVDVNIECFGVHRASGERVWVGVFN